MARDLSTALNTELTASALRPVVFFSGEFDGGFVRLWSGLSSIEWDGETWLGAGGLLNISPIEETADIKATGVAISMSGIPASRISTALSAARQGLPGKVWIGALDQNGAIIADPYLAFSGRLDVPELDEQGDTATITITYESRLIALERTNERRYTHEDQQIDYPGDMGFEFVPALQDKQIKWGRA
jgi:hypothetical protein